MTIAPPFTGSQIDGFKEYVHEICESRGIRLIAEEMTEMALNNKGVKETIFASVAKSLGIDHDQSIDLDSNERLKLGIDDYSIGNISARENGGVADQSAINLLNKHLSDPIRERVWYAKLLGKNLWPAIFICGAEHVENLADLVKMFGQEVNVTNRDYQP